MRAGAPLAHTAAPALVALAALAVSVALARPAAAAPRAAPRPDADAVAEARGAGPISRGRAIGHYLAARRCQEAGDWACAAAELQQAVDYDGESAELRVALAEALAASGDAGSAEAEARRAVELAAGRGDEASRAHVLLAQLARRRDRDAAAVELRRAIRIETELAEAGTEPDPEPWSLLATLYLEIGDEAAAQRALEDLAEHAPREGAAEREAGRWLLEHGQPGRAEQHLRRALAAARDDLAAWRLLVHAHRALGRSPDVNDDLRAVLALDAADPEALLGLGRAALEDGELERARELLDRYQRGARDRAGAGAVASAEWLAVGRAEEALEAAQQALREAPAGGDARPRLAEGLALLALRRHADAVRSLARVRAEDGDAWLPSRVALATALSRAGRPAEALRAVEVASARWPGDPQLALAHAAALEWSGRAGESAAALARAAEERERQGELAAADALRAARGGVLCRAGQARDAAGALQIAVATRPRSPALRLALAAALEEAGEGDLAEAELRALLALAPDEPIALARLAARLAGRAAALAPEAGALLEAEALARRAVKGAPRSPEALAALGRVLTARGDHAGAVAALERAAAYSRRAARWLEALGEAYRAAGRSAEARAVWRAALEAAGDEPPATAARLRAGLRRKLQARSP